MSELATTIREALAALASSDPAFKRFGAAHHRYRLAPPIEIEIEIEVADLREFITTIGSAGAGPYYGLLSPRESPSGLVVGHLGCGYAAVVGLDGRVSIDARAVGVVRPIAESFLAYYLEWIDRLAHGMWPEAYVPGGTCPLPNALGGFLGVREKQRGLEPGTLAGDDLREVLAELGPHSIEIAAESSVVFPDGARVDPCVSCARLIENLGADGLRGDVVAPGRSP